MPVNPTKVAKIQQGQNLVELVFVLPLLLVFLFAIFELGHFWQTAESAKMAAMDGVNVAAKTNNAGIGRMQLLFKLSQAQLTPTGPTDVTANADGSGYTATVQVDYRPYFGALTIPTLSGPISLLPASVPIRYQEIKAINIL
jgi:Flp pilus assembly protein TadG